MVLGGGGLGLRVWWGGGGLRVGPKGPPGERVLGGSPPEGSFPGQSEPWAG